MLKQQYLLNFLRIAQVFLMGSAKVTGAILCSRQEGEY